MSSQADGPTSPTKPTKVPTDDRSGTKKVTCSDKLNNKLSNKPTRPSDDLAEIIAVWPDLPEHIKAAIKALIQKYLKGKE